MCTPFPVRITAACLLVTMSACTTWQPYPLEGSGELPRPVRVTTTSDEVVVLYSARLTQVVDGDSIVWGRLRRTGQAPVHRVPLREVVSLEVAHRSAGRTALVVLGVTVAWLGLTAWGLERGWW
jgi:hypothetical protein